MCYANDDNEFNLMGMMAGVCIMVLSFFGGFLFMISNIDTLNIGGILFFIMVVPMIGFFIGFAVMYKTNKKSFSSAGMFGSARPSAGSSESFVYEPPERCPNCKGVLSAENIEWVGPLTAKCPYCGSSVKTEKRRV
ncbi:MAG: hypothetical protein JW779_15020 [Candidatus Thorarchaeota archaeon]|nr:hypothetical protein [Candidatus Thorarchaeota archaeon]